MIEAGSLTIAAFFVGFLVGLTGVGGGAIMTPLLIIVFSVQPVVAIATDLIFATITKSASVVVHVKNSSVHWGLARAMWKGSVPGAILGSLFLVFVGGGFTLILTTFLIFVLLATAVSMLRTPKRLLESNWRPSPVVSGAGLGFSVATTSIGAGALGMAILRNRIGDANPRLLVGTDVVHAIPITVIAGLTYGSAGLVDAQLLLTLLIGSIPGVFLGAALTGKMPTTMLRKALGSVILVAALGLILKTMDVI